MGIFVAVRGRRSYPASSLTCFYGQESPWVPAQHPGGGVCRQNLTAPATCSVVANVPLPHVSRGHLFPASPSTLCFHSRALYANPTSANAHPTGGDAAFPTPHLLGCNVQLLLVHSDNCQNATTQRLLASELQCRCLACPSNPLSPSINYPQATQAFLLAVVVPTAQPPFTFQHPRSASPVRGPLARLQLNPPPSPRPSRSTATSRDRHRCGGDRRGRW